MRKDIHIEVITDPYDRASQNAIAFTVSFDHKNPKIAHEVADDLVNLFLQENIETRTKRATETTQFLREQAQKLSAQASAIDAKVAKFKQEHSDTLPEHLNLKVDMLNTAQSTVKSLERDIASTEEERRFLLTQRVSGGAMLSTRDGSGHLVLSPRQELVVLKAELAEKSGIYSPSHPDIRSLERRISTLERLVQVKSSDDGLESAANPAKAEIESQIRSAELRLQSMRAQEQDVQQSIKRLQAQIIEIPQVERALKDLTRNYDNAMKEYQAMQAKVQQAQVAQNLEHEKKAERFELLERPTVPVAPVWPKKPQLIGIAFALALGTGGGTVFAAEMLDQSIRGPAMLTSLVGRHPLAVIPYIESLLDQRSTKRKRHMRHLLRSVALLLMVLAGIALLYLLSSPYGRAVPAFG